MSEGLSKSRFVLLLGLVAVATACSGGGSGGSTSSPLTASFTPDELAPGSETVAMAENASAGDQVTIDVNITDTADVYGISFDVTFDPDDLAYEDWDPGTLLEQGDNDPEYVITELSGQLVVSASRLGNVPGATATGSVPVIRLTFRATAAGGHAISFQNPDLLDSQVQPQPIPGIDWFGGAVTAI